MNQTYFSSQKRERERKGGEWGYVFQNFPIFKACGKYLANVTTLFFAS